MKTTQNRARPQALWGVLLVTLAAGFWGLSGIFVAKILEHGGTAISLAFWRDAAACLTFSAAGLLGQPGAFCIRKKDLPWFLAMGIFLGGFHIVYNQSVFLNGAGVTTVMQAAMPAIVVVAAFRLWNETPSPRKVTAVGLIFLGTVLASGIGASGWSMSGMSGVLCGFSVPLLYAGWSLCGKTMTQTYGAVVSLAIAFGIASLMLAPLQPFTDQPFPVTGPMAAAFAGLIALSTFAAFGLYLTGMQYIQAGVASILVMSEILFAGVYAWWFLGERYSPVQTAGALLVAAGVVRLSMGRRNRRQTDR